MVGTCNTTSNKCSYACAFSATCLNGTTVCSSWSFESKTVEGWVSGVGNLDPPLPVSNSTLHPAVGSSSLLAPVATIARIEVPLCAGINANLAGKRFHAQVWFDSQGIAFDNTSSDLNEIFVRFTTDPNIPPFAAASFLYQAFFDPAAASLSIQPNGWESIDFTIPSDSVTTQTGVIQIGVQFSGAPASYTRGNLFIDDVRIF
jgi:hypothetical protein